MRPAWSDEVEFGRKLTYPTLVCGADDTLYMTARRSYGKMPWTVEMWKKPVGKDWEMVGTILRSRAVGYSHFQEALAWGPDHKRLHLSVRIHENRGAVEVVGYMFKRRFRQDVARPKRSAACAAGFGRDDRRDCLGRSCRRKVESQVRHDCCHRVTESRSCFTRLRTVPVPR
ncbi:MAG: hypothetical protein Ct9H300mP1_03180 [Planctomycetaceae bacterium]|nr:MAG: hypothetical protein Ct9H300mP1_03180 [Planctomycetaceae bacterium]